LRNLSVAPQNLIAAYQGSGSPGEFHNAIMKLKPQAVKRGTVNSNLVSEPNQGTREISDTPKDSDNLFEPAPALNGESSSTLEEEVSKLKTAISEKEQKIGELQNLLEKAREDLIIRDDAINSLRRFMGKVRLNLELKTDRSSLFNLISKEEWIYEKKFGYLKIRNQEAGAEDLEK
jgi:hypothetical protein